MDRAEILAKVQEMIAEEFGISKEEVTPEKDIQKDLGADSLRTVELMMAIEDAFSIENIPDEVVEKIKTVGDLVEAIIRLEGDDDQRGTAVPA